ncbi:hypothetical protein LINPERHAP2_LOCUS39171 [Linum perenne]
MTKKFEGKQKAESRKQRRSRKRSIKHRRSQKSDKVQAFVKQTTSKKKGKGKGIPPSRSPSRLKVSHGNPINVDSCPAAERRKFETAVGITGNMHNNIKLAILKKGIEECRDDNAFNRMFILRSLGTLLVPGNSWKISMNYAKYLN